MGAREEVKDYFVKIRKTRIAAGLCAVCGKRPAEEGKTRCERCAVAAKNYYQKRKNAGLCVTCGKRPAVHGKVRCTECAAAHREHERECRNVYGQWGGFDMMHEEYCDTLEETVEAAASLNEQGWVIKRIDVLPVQGFKIIYCSDGDLDTD